MAVDFVKTGISVGAGAVTVLARKNDKSNARTESFKTANDLVNLIGAGLGYGIQALWPRYERIGEALALSFTPGLTVSLYNAAVKEEERAGAPAFSEARFVPRKKAGSFSRQTYPEGERASNW